MVVGFMVIFIPWDPNLLKNHVPGDSIRDLFIIFYPRSLEVT